MRFGILGFPKSGKTTLFNLLTGSHVHTDKYAPSRGEANVGVVHVPEPRLPRLQELFGSAKAAPVSLDYLDFPGVAKGEFTGLDLAEFRNVDAVLHVARAFDDPEIPHAEGSVDAARDMELAELEMILADLSIAEKRLQKLEKELMKNRTKEGEREQAVLRKCRDALEGQRPLRELKLSQEEDAVLRGFAFLSRKPLLHAVNLGEEASSSVADPAGAIGLERPPGPGTGIVGVCAEIEDEIAQLDGEDAELFRQDAGIGEPAIDRVVRASYDLLRIVTFFTGNEKEVHAWTVPDGATALQAAGRVHTDMERGFIRAEVASYDDLDSAGAWAPLRESGALAVHGKEYVVREGDVILFRFNV
jgi:GTP-binding protein YchF